MSIVDKQSQQTDSVASRSPQFDQAKADQFSDRLVSAVNEAGVVLMLSIGHRTGLFDTLARMTPATSEQVAAEAGLNERYVREWLNSMVAGKVIDYDPAEKLYSLSSEHASLLTRSAVPNNFASVAQWISVLGGVEDDIVEKFHTGGGIGYERFHRFHHVMADESGQTVVWALLDHILPLDPGLRQKLERGIDVLDVGCGAGRAMIMLARTFPNSRFTGIDLCEDAIALARQHARDERLTNVTFEAKDDTQIEGSARFDLITAFDAVHDQADPAGLLRSIVRLLRPDGTFLMQDIGVSSHPEKNASHPLGAFIYTISCMHCMTVSLAQNGAGLGAAWGEELAQKMLAEAGFKNVTTTRLPHDIINNYYVCKLA
jgi:2-polyprenyl-3-methyl-5-hydroxy-6-metoxy-1,4-benzoquinol methylase